MLNCERRTDRQGEDHRHQEVDPQGDKKGVPKPIEGLHGAGETGEHRSHQRHRTEDGDQEVHQPVHPAWRPQ